MAFGALGAIETAIVRADGVDGSIGLVSDKVLRGISQTGGRPAVVADLGDHLDSAWTASAEWTVPRSASPRSHSFATLGLAYSTPLSDNLTALASYAHYAYLGDARQHAYDSDEFGASVDLNGGWSASATVSPRVAVVGGGRLRHGAAISYEVGVRQRLVARWTVNGGLGYRDLRIAADGGYSYGYGSVGLGTGLGPLQLDLVFIETTAGARRTALTGPAGSRWVASAVWPF